MVGAGVPPPGEICAAEAEMVSICSAAWRRRSASSAGCLSAAASSSPGGSNGKRCTWSGARSRAVSSAQSGQAGADRVSALCGCKDGGPSSQDPAYGSAVSGSWLGTRSSSTNSEAHDRFSGTVPVAVKHARAVTSSASGVGDPVAGGIYISARDNAAWAAVCGAGLSGLHVAAFVYIEYGGSG